MSTTRSSNDPTETILDPDRLVHLGIWRDEVSEISSRFFTWTVPKLTVVQQRSIAVGSVPGSRHHSRSGLRSARTRVPAH
jgi:hypothetical protein